MCTEPAVCTEPVCLSILFETSNRRSWDVDNRVKALQDCLSAAGVIHDDTQIEELHVKKDIWPKNGHHDSFKSLLVYLLNKMQNKGILGVNRGKNNFSVCMFLDEKI